MPRVKGGPQPRRRHKKIIKQAKGYRGLRHKVFKRANESVLHALRAMFRDNVKARCLGADGHYTRAAGGRGDAPCRVQDLLQDEARRRMAAAIERAGVTFRPAVGTTRA